MGIVKSYINDSVIQEYLNGEILDQIVKETGVSKGTVYNLVKHWKDNLGSTGVEEMREFTRIVNKSGMTIQECAQGFRIAQILKELGINDEFEELDHFASEQDFLEEIRNKATGWKSGKNDHYIQRSSGHVVAKGGGRIGHTLSKNDFHHFIEEIYNNCKKHGIKSSYIIGFIKDLIDCYSSLKYEAHSAVNKDEADVFIEIPFISQVSYHINQIKLECKEQEKQRKSLYDEIYILENRKSTLENNLREIINKNNNILSHLQWYDFLNQDLSDNYNMNLDEEITFFSSIINDFKTYNYNILDILKEYRQIQYFRKERDQIQCEIDLNRSLYQDLINTNTSLNSQLDFSRQTIKIYQDLSAIGFDLKRLKQLYGIIIEIASANHIPAWDAFTKFLNDIENQYDYKLGFETKIKELSTTMEKIKAEIPQYKSKLEIQFLVNASL